MLASGPLFLAIVLVVVAIYSIASIIGISLAGGFRNQKKRNRFIDFLIWLGVTPIGLGLYGFSFRLLWDTPIGNPAVTLLLLPALIGLVLGTAIGGIKKLFQAHNV